MSCFMLCRLLYVYKRFVARRGPRRGRLLGDQQADRQKQFYILLHVSHSFYAYKSPVIRRGPRLER